MDSQREGKKERERENFPIKDANLIHSLVHSQNKGLSEYGRGANWLHTGSSPRAGGREAGMQQPEPEDKGQSHPQRLASSDKL